MKKSYKRPRKKKPEPEPKPVFDAENVAKRLRYVDLPAFVHGLFDAIDGARVMTGSLPPEECDEERESLNQLRKTVVFVFGVDR